MLLMAVSLHLEYSANVFPQIIKSRNFMLNIGNPINHMSKSCRKVQNFYFGPKFPATIIYGHYISSVLYTNNN